MAEWLYEAGIGEARAACIEQGKIIEARVERDASGAWRTGEIVAAQLGDRLPQGGAHLRVAASRPPLTLDIWPKSHAQGATILAEVIRESIAETGNTKPARARLAEEGASVRPGADLRARISDSGHPVRELHLHDPDALEAAGWSEVLDIARTGIMPFDGGQLRLSVTPAMALIDIDGHLPALDLCIAGAQAAGHMIRLLDLSGSIGLDLPVPAHAGKADRQKAAHALDAALPPPFERTSVNGFGFLQIIRKRARMSLPEILASHRPRTAALQLLRQAQRASGHGPRKLTAAPPVIAQLEANPAWLDTLSRQLGVPVSLQAALDLAIDAGHVHCQTP